MADLVYLESRALKYVESWPTVPAVFTPIAHRLFEAGILQSYDGQDEQHHSALTPIGEAIVFFFQGQGLNYASVRRIMDLWPLSELRARSERATNFLRLFKLDWRDPDVLHYMGARREEIRFTRLRNDTEHPFTGKIPRMVPSIANLMPFLDETFVAADYKIIEQNFIDDDEPDFGVDEKAHVETVCDYCEGTGIDPFEDTQTCPQCGTEDEWDII